MSSVAALFAGFPAAISFVADFGPITLSTTASSAAAIDIREDGSIFATATPSTQTSNWMTPSVRGYGSNRVYVSMTILEGELNRESSALEIMSTYGRQVDVSQWYRSGHVKMNVYLYSDAGITQISTGLVTLTAANPIDFTGIYGTIGTQSSAAGAVTVTIGNGGQVTITNGIYTTNSKWYTPTSASPLVYPTTYATPNPPFVQVSLVSGAASGTFDTYLSLGTSRVYTVASGASAVLRVRTYYEFVPGAYAPASDDTITIAP